MKKSMFIDFDRSKGSLYCANSIKKAGFSHTFLWWGKDDDNRFNQVKICERIGLEIETAHTSFENINSMWLEGTVGEEMTDYFIKSVREAKEFSIPTLIVHVSSSNTPPPFGELGLNRYTKICEEADKQRIKIAFENLRRIDYLDYIMQNIEVKSKHFCFDCGHEMLYKGTTEVLEKYASLLTALHLHDNFGDEDDHILPFDGKINWATLAKRIAQAMKLTNSEIPITLEVMKNNSELDFAEKAFERACRIEALITASLN
ncbi:MAG: hypothetical protein A2Y15_06390 [Clostridiales bacterium GWF2_36_10]|nr:MAG: hypothetical protein A2Y15_06390 [Clostridiales bacterium GWF2_36_10]HAN21857.1 hypothetical protein [Clostridiales bacterium]